MKYLESHYTVLLLLLNLRTDLILFLILYCHYSLTWHSYCFIALTPAYLQLIGCCIRSNVSCEMWGHVRQSHQKLYLLSHVHTKDENGEKEAWNSPFKKIKLFVPFTPSSVKTTMTGSPFALRWSLCMCHSSFELYWRQLPDHTLVFRCLCNETSLQTCKSVFQSVE